MVRDIGATGRGGRAHRIFVEGDLGENAVIAATPDQQNYLGNVLRLKAGDHVLLFNGRHGEWRARLESEGKRHLSLRAMVQTRDQTPQADLWLLFAPLKHARLDYMVQKATEMGVSALYPVVTRYTQVHQFSVARARANCIEAAEQCGILNIPAVREPAPLSDVVANWSASRLLVFCDEGEESGSPLASLSQSLSGAPALSFAVLIGPEGGFHPDERAALRAVESVQAISLGPRILRADTAAVAALAILQASLGDWGRSRADNLRLTRNERDHY